MLATIAVNKMRNGDYKLFEKIKNRAPLLVLNDIGR